MARPEPLLVAGRYALYDEIASGGMATVHLGRLAGAAGFARVVAIKRLHPQHAKNPEIVAMLMDEARLAARVHHPNVAATIDVLEEGGEVLLVFEYVAGESLGSLVRLARARGDRLPADVASAIGVGALLGLHAAHEARAVDGTPLEIVHRDVSPQNVLVGADGVARVIDFGIAKANLRSSATREGELKGKLIYMPPEQLAGRDVTRASDVYAAGVVLWELLAGRRLFDQPTHAGIVAAILAGTIPRLADEAPWVPAAAATVVERALAMEPAMRWQTASAMASALAQALPPASPQAVAALVESVAAESLGRRRAAVARVESAPAVAIGAAAGASRDRGLRPVVIAVALVGVSLATGAGIALAWLGGGADETAAERARIEEGHDDVSARAIDDAAASRDAAGGAPAEVPPPETVPPEDAEIIDLDADDEQGDGALQGEGDEGGDATDPAGSATAPAQVGGPSKPGGRRPARPPARLPACDPPWEIDEQGIRRVKRHCLGR